MSKKKQQIKPKKQQGERKRLIWKLPKEARLIPVSAENWTWGTHPGHFEYKKRKKGTNRKKGKKELDDCFAEKDGVIKVTFDPVIYIRKGLDSAAKSKILEHERRHAKDFRDLADALKKAVEQKIKNKEDPQFEKRWARFKHDVCEAANTFHREEMKMNEDLHFNTEICEEAKEVNE